MSSLPPAIFFINGDITYPAAAVFIGSQPLNPSSYIASASELTTLQTQLFIDDTMTKAEFDARVAADPKYPIIIHLRGLRILVILPTFHDPVNRHHADVVLFLHLGLADVEMNRFWFDEHPDGYYDRHRESPYGPPEHSFDMQRITMYSLLRAAYRRDRDHDHDHDRGQEINLPFEMSPHCDQCNYPFYCDRCHTFSGIRTCWGCKCDCICGCSLIDNQGVRYSGIHLPNCENEYHNRDFINRK